MEKKIQDLMNRASKEVSEKKAQRIQDWLLKEWVTKENSNIFNITHSYSRLNEENKITHERLILKKNWKEVSKLEIKLNFKL